MKIGEIPANSTIQVRVIKDKLRYECLAVVVATRDDGLFLTPIKHDGQLVDFSSPNVQILAFYVNADHMALGWSGCRIRKDTYQGKRCHLLTTKHASVRVNRRMEPRIRTEMNAVLRTIMDDKEQEIVVRNYSESGIGFVCAKSIAERDWKPVSIIYEDRLQQMGISMRADVLWCNELSNGLFRYGAHILHPDEMWVKYVQRKLAEIREQNQPEDDTGVNRK